MSKGPGRVQRVVLGLIATEPDGVFTIAELRHMPLPGTWSVGRLSRAPAEFCLFDPCNDESQTRVRWLEDLREPDCHRWKERFPYLIERALADAADARRWRDASPVEKLDAQIAEAQKMLGMMRMAGVADPASMRRDVERLVGLQAARAERAKLTVTV
jgi:hypothetical protein